MSEENIELTDWPFAPHSVDHHAYSDMNLNRHCLINNNVSIPKNVINLYISYILYSWLINLNTGFH